jgi:hypothetical protein
MRHRRLALFLGPLRIVLAPLALPPISAWAAPTFHVNSLADVPASANVYDGVCETAPGNGVCTLRAAVMEANHVASGGATILVPAGVYALTIAPTDTGNDENGDLDLNATMTVQGEGPSATIVDGNAITRVFFAAAPGVVIKGLTIRNGAVPGLTVASGVANWDELTLENVVVSHNHGGIGGGIYNQGTLTVRHCIIEDNTADDDGGGIANSSGTAMVQDTLVQQNAAPNGAGIWSAAEMTIERSSIIGNADGVYGNSFSNGAGVYSDAPPGSRLVMLNDEVTTNSSRGAGGGIYVYRGSASLINLTVSANVANSAFENPVLLSPGGPFGGGIGTGISASVFLKNSIVVGNLSGGMGFMLEPDDCGPNAIISGDYIIRSPSIVCYLTGQKDHVDDVDPVLDVLALDGGFSTLQVAGYFATGAIPPASCTDALGAPLTVDARGYERPAPLYATSYPNCDIGAVQVFGNYAPAELLGVELLRNGGAAGDELGEASDDTSLAAPPPYWYQPGGTMTQVVYGSPSPAAARSDAPAGSGSYFFSGGNSANPTADQYIDVSPLAAQIDAGQIHYRLAGAFGGYGSSPDSAWLTVFFANDAATLGTDGIGGFTAADRGNVTKLIPTSHGGVLPAGTRYITVQLSAERGHDANPPYNTGYADDLSLRLPEPAADPLAAAALAVLAAARRRVQRRVRRRIEVL